MSRPPSVLIFVLDRVTLGDLLAAPAPHLHRFIREGAAGLMNFASARGRTPEGSHATLSAGIHAVADTEAGLFLEAGEPYEGGSAADAFLRRTGRVIPTGAVGCLGIARLRKVNEERRTLAVVGAMGGIAGRYGPTVILGNNDAPGEEKPARYAALLAMNPFGIVDRGHVGKELLRQDRSAPYGVATDPSRLESAYRLASPGSSLVVVELGETTRVEKYGDFLSMEARIEHRRRAIARADVLFQRIKRRVDTRKTTTILVTPAPPANRDDSLVNLPLMVIGDGPKTAIKGLLTSTTTRGEGLIANIDLAPTLERLIAPSSYRTPTPAGSVPMMTGTPIRVVRSPDPLSTLARLDAAITAQRMAAAGPFLYAMAGLGLFLALLAIAMVWPAAGRRGTDFRKTAARLSLCLIAFLPVAPVVSGRWLPDSPGRIAAWGLAVWILLALPFLALGRRAIPVAMAAGGILLLVDLAMGGWGLRLSPISDFPIVGVRFHGLANEYEGILVGALLIGATALLEPPTDRRRRLQGSLILASILIVVLVGIGLPTLGDNAGGVFTAMFAFGAAILGWNHRPLRLRELAGLFAAAVAFLGLLVLFDRSPDGATHIGGAFDLARRHGWSYLPEIAFRKVSLNLSMMADAKALAAYAGFVLLAGVAYLADGGRTQAILREKPGLSIGIRSAIVGAAAAWVFNDTGIVPAILLLATSIVGILAAMAESSLAETGVGIAFAHENAPSS